MGLPSDERSTVRPVKADDLRLLQHRNLLRFALSCAMFQHSGPRIQMSFWSTPGAEREG